MVNKTNDLATADSSVGQSADDRYWEITAELRKKYLPEPLTYFQKLILEALEQKGPMTLAQITTATSWRRFSKREALKILRQLKRRGDVRTKGTRTRYWMTRDDEIYFITELLTPGKGGDPRAEQEAINQLINEYVRDVV